MLNPINYGMYKTVREKAACEAQYFSRRVRRRRKSVLFLLLIYSANRLVKTFSNIFAGIPPACVVVVETQIRNPLFAAVVAKLAR